MSSEWNTHAVVWRNKADLDTMSMDDLYNNLKVYEPEVKGMSSSSSSTQNMAFVSSSNNNTSSTNEAVNTAHGVSTTSTQVNVANSTNIDNLSDAIICAVFASQPNSPQLVHERGVAYATNEPTVVRGGGGTIYGLGVAELQKIEKTDHGSTEGGASDQAEEGPNYALMAFSSLNSDSEVSNDSICLKSCLKTIESLQSQNDQLLKDLKKSELMVLGYKTGLKSVEEKLEVYKANESIYLQDIKGLKFEIHIGEIAIRELTKKLEIVQKEKDGIQLNVKLKFIMHQKFKQAHEEPDSVTIARKFVNEPVVENCKAKSSKEDPKVVRKNDDSPNYRKHGVR
ncbi:hypothetical protein Tco_1524987 [Tanacetum coccineum]